MPESTIPIKNKGALWTTLLMAVAIVALIVVVAFTFNVLTIQALAGFNLKYVIYIGFGIVLLVVCDSLSTMVFAAASKVRIPAQAAIKSSFLRVFINMVTPFGVGGHPFVIAYLKDKGVPGGVGSSITAAKLMIVSVLVLVGGVVGFFWLPADKQVSDVVRLVFGISILLQALLISLLLFLMVRPQSAVGILTRLVGLFHKTKIAANIASLKNRTIHEAWLTRYCFRRYFRQGKALFLLGCLLHLVMYIVELLLLWFVFLGLGLPIALPTCLAIASLTLLLISFLPTPGGSGLGEGAFVLLFAGVAPIGILGIAVVLWRVFYSYLIALVGLILSPSVIGRITGRKKLIATDAST